MKLLSRSEIFHLIRRLDPVVGLNVWTICIRNGWPRELLDHFLDQGWVIATSGGLWRLSPKGIAARDAMIEAAIDVWGRRRIGGIVL